MQGYGDQCNGGQCGYSAIGGVTLNTALSTADCRIKVGKPMCDARSDKKSTMWVVCLLHRIARADSHIPTHVPLPSQQVVQVTGTQCVIDYYARVAIGASKFPGSSLQVSRHSHHWL